MTSTKTFPAVGAYAARLADTLRAFDWSKLDPLVSEFLDIWNRRATVWICGNGGSAANAVHWANDFLYPVAKKSRHGIKIHALSSNPAVVTCLGNDIGYDKIYSYQLSTQAVAGDLLIVLSGSGNSPNIVDALQTAHALGLKTCAILGFDGGAALQHADFPLHFAIGDMQVAEDVQMVVCHALVQALVEDPSRPLR